MTTDPIIDTKAREYLTALLEFTTDFILIADHNAKPILFNRAYAEAMHEALGIDMAPGLQPHKLLPDPEAVAYWDGLHRRVLSGESFTVEVAQDFPDSGLRYFSFSFTPTFKDGKVAGFCEISREITERVHADAALAESAQLLRESQEAAQIGTYCLDVTTGVWTSSPILDTVFGIGPDDERTVKSWIAIVHPQFRRTMMDYFTDHVIGRGERFDREYMIVRADDRAERWVHGLGRLEFDDAGNPTRMIGTIRDITERKEIELRLRQHEKLEAIGQLAGGIAHDFNNQLVAILGFADLLRERVAEDDELSAFADNILTGANRAAALTNQLLAFSRKGKNLNAPVDLNRLAEEVVTLLRHTIDKRISVSQALEAAPSVTLGDPTQLESAVLNLGLNARDALPDGGVITFATDVVVLDADACAALPMPTDPGAFVRLVVSDTGCGIEPSLQARIFEPFFTTKKRGKGTGMGLAAVYGTIKNHHGCVMVDSTPEQGSTFSVYLPLALETEAPEAEPEPVTTGDHGLIRVLLVDDEASVRDTVVAMLANRGLAVSTCTNGAEAVEFYRDHWRDIDVVILDLMMPKLDGGEAYLAMRAINPEIKAIIASGFGLENEAQTLIDRGVKRFVKKPFTIRQLLADIAATHNDG